MPSNKWFRHWVNCLARRLVDEDIETQDEIHAPRQRVPAQVILLELKPREIPAIGLDRDFRDVESNESDTAEVFGAKPVGTEPAHIAASHIDD